MDVGQVSFTVTANGLDATLQQAIQLEKIMNGLDGKTFGKWNKDAAKAQAANDKHAYMTAKTEREQAQKELINDRKQALINNIQRKKQADAEKQRLTDERNYNKAVQRSLRNHKALIKQTEREAAIRQKEAEAIANAPRVFQQSMEQNLVRFGSRMQTLGATLQKVTSPFMDVYRGIAMGVGYRLLGSFTNSIQGAFKRFDIMKMYTKMMDEFSTKKFTAEMSKKMLDMSVRGLPTGLGEIMEMAQRYTLSLGDMERGTKLAIASNRAFLASMATETQQYQGMLQLQDLMNGKKLQAREWMSLGASMGKAINEIARVMGADTQEEIRDFRKQLYAGKIDTEEFLDALIKVGTEGGVIYKKAEHYKDTIEALQRNITNAFERMGEHILTAFDEIAETFTGKGLVANLKGITEWIDKTSESAQKWIKANPEKILDFFNEFKSIDWGGILKGFVQMGGYLAKFYGGLLKTFGGSGLVKWAININMLGKTLQIVGGLTKGLAGPISKLLTFFAFGESAKMGKAIAGATKLANHGKTLVAASRTVQGVALTWQGIANKALNIVGIGVIAGAIKLLADAFVSIGNSNVNLQQFEGFAAGAAVLIGEFAGLAQVLGAKGLVTGVMQASRVLGELEIGAIAGDVILISKALNSISNVKIPQQSKINRVLKSVEGFANALPSMDFFTALGKRFSGKAVQSAAKAVTSITEAINSVNQMKGSLKKFAKVMFGNDAVGGNGGGGGSWGSDPNSIVGIMNMMLNEFENNEIIKTFSEKYKASNIESVFESLANMMENFVSIANTKIKSGQIKRATANIKTLSDSIMPLLDAFDAMYSMEFGTAAGMGKTQAERKGARSANKSISSTYGAQAKGFTTMMEQLDSTLKFVSWTITRLNNMQGKLSSLKKNYGEDIDLSVLSSVMSSISSAFDEAGVATGNYSLAPTNMDYIDEALKTLGKVTDKMISIKSNLTALEGSEGDFTEIGTMLGDMVSDLIAACSNAPELQQYIDTLQETVDKIQELVDSIPNKYKKKTKVEIDGKVDDDVSPEVEKVKKKIARVVASIPSVITKTVNIRVRGVASAIGVSGLNAAMQALNKSQHGGRVYREEGGSIRRGTDTVEALLTPGEWVMNRHATSMLGSDILNKLNHLDIRGALNSLSLKAGQVQSRTINNNSTKNANVTVNNYHSDGIGYGRASRVVRAL